jgi:UDP-2-acetamido-3-amino-2,3-dideoxy-glucuronate N-acetyltransferase
MPNPEPVVHATTSIGEGVVIWAGTQIRENAVIGDRTSIGQYCYVGPGVHIGKDCKIQNQALIYEPAVVEDAVFIGPRVIITNDLNPRAVRPDGAQKTSKDWTAIAAKIEYGASLGAGCICVGAVTVGKWAMVAAGSVVVKDVPPYALVAGVPAKQIGWVGRAGVKLVQESNLFVCPVTGETFQLKQNNNLTLIENS